MADYGDILLEAVQTVVDGSISKLQFDKTIICNIVKNDKANKGEYSVSDGATTFLAYCDKVENFNIKNAKYDLENYTLYLGDNRTVSNEFLEDDIEVEFTKGKILVIFSKD